MSLMNAHSLLQRPLSWILVGLAAAGCADGEVTWAEFGEPADAEVLVVADDADCDGVEVAPPVDILSNVVSGIVGTVTIEPQCGSVGTEHQVVVSVGEDWEEVVGRATLEIIPGPGSDLDGDGDADARAELLFEMERDAAFPGQYGLRLLSQGTPGDERTDVFRFQLLQPEQLAPDLSATDG